MEPYDPGLDPGELGGVGEGLCSVDGAQPLTAATRQRAAKSRCLSKGRDGSFDPGDPQPLTQLQLGNKLPSLRNPLPKERGVVVSLSYETAYSHCPAITA
jgi:hypothetical protein